MKPWIQESISHPGMWAWYTKDGKCGHATTREEAIINALEVEESAHV